MIYTSFYNSPRALYPRIAEILSHPHFPRALLSCKIEYRMDSHPSQSRQHAGVGTDRDEGDEDLYLQPFTPDESNANFSFTAAPKMTKSLMSHPSMPSSSSVHHQQQHQQHKNSSAPAEQQQNSGTAEQQRTPVRFMGNGKDFMSCRRDVT